MTALRDEVDETVGLHELLPSGERVVVDQVESHQELRRHYTDIGDPDPVAHGAPGKAILSALPWSRQQAVLARPISPVTAHTVTDPDRLTDELDVARRRGWAGSDAERTPGIRAVASPVFDHTGARRRRHRPVGAERAHGRRACRRARAALRRRGLGDQREPGRDARRGRRALSRRLPVRRAEQVQQGPGEARPRHPRRRAAPGLRRPADAHRDGVPGRLGVEPLEGHERVAEQRRAAGPRAAARSPRPPRGCRAPTRWCR